MKEKKNVLIIFGGKSVEHEVSIRSARSIVEAIDKDTYNVLLVGIDQDSKWLPCSVERLVSDDSCATVSEIFEKNVNQQVIPYSADGMLHIQIDDTPVHIDVVFPVLHGTLGEDGTIQGLLTMAQVPFVGADVLGSAIGMDKDVAKRLLREAGLPVGDYVVGYNYRRQDLAFNTLSARLGLPFFVKPANAGSSVGVSKVHNESEFIPALEEAFRYDSKILIEKYIQGREVECAVLGNDEPEASVPGDIVMQHADFYSYDAKYIDEDGAMLIIPTQVSDQAVEKVRSLAVAAFRALCCKGMARVDFFATENEELYINEINTLPGFTSISMYPKLWEYSGISYATLIDTLLNLAIERFEQQKKQVSTFRAQNA